MLGAVGEVKEKGVDWLNVEGLFGADSALDADCVKGLLLFGGPPNANEVDVFVAATTGAGPKENPLVEVGVVGTASAGCLKEKADAGAFWPKAPNPRPLFSCFSSGLAAKGLGAEAPGAPANENGDELP